MKKLLLSALLCAFTLITFAQAKDKTTTHKVEKGETLYSISKKYHVTVAAIESANKSLTGDMKIKPGQSITIPVAVAKADTKTTAATKPEPKKTDKPAPATTTDKKATGTTSPAKPKARLADDNPLNHTIAKGESLYSLARTYGVSVRHLREANNMSEDAPLKVGQKLNIPSKNPEAMFKPAETKPAESAPVKAEADNKATQPGREYMSNDNAVETKKDIEPAKPAPTPVKITEEKPTTPPVTDKPKEIVKEEKAPEPKEPKSPPVEPAKNSNISPSDYSSVFSGYGTSGKKKVVYRGIGSFLKTENPGNQFLALYNYADMGAILKVTNLMSKQAIYVKVIGKVPAADAQNEIILKVSSEAATQLKVTEDKFLVEVTGYSAP